MTFPRLVKPTPKDPPTLQAHAMDNLRYIRKTMEGATRFTAVSGWGQMLVGATALVAAGLASRQATPQAWFQVWLAEAVAAFAVGGGAILVKARRSEHSLFSPPGRKFVLGLLPSLFAGALLTYVLYERGLFEALPGLWLLLYGAAVLAGGAFSVPSIPMMGSGCLVLGTLALFAPADWGDVLLAMGFGGFNLLVGLFILWRHGG